MEAAAIDGGARYVGLHIQYNCCPPTRSLHSGLLPKLSIALYTDCITYELISGEHASKSARAVITYVCVSVRVRK